jgi:hypothetical protein
MHAGSGGKDYSVVEEDGGISRRLHDLAAGNAVQSASIERYRMRRSVTILVGLANQTPEPLGWMIVGSGSGAPVDATSSAPLVWRCCRSQSTRVCR